MELQPNRFKQILNNPIIQTLVIFVSGGWIVLEITEYFIENFGLDEAARKVLLIIIITVLPIAIFVAWYSNHKRTARDERIRASSFTLRRRKVIIPSVLIVIAIGTSIGFRVAHKSRFDSALNIKLPKLQDEITFIDISDGQRNWMAYHKAIELRKILRNNPEFHQLWNDITVKVKITTDPEGAKVYAKPYAIPYTAWIYMGDVPLSEYSIPRGLSRIKIEKPGFEIQYDILYNSFGYHDEEVPRHYKLYRPDERPEGMLHAQGFKGGWIKTGNLPELTAGDFWIDRCEVTNQQYKSFVDEGGYTNPSYWESPFVDGDDTLLWENAIKGFKDNTGRPGPSSWEMGDFPGGEEDLPVSGISWYEAAAYATYVKKELPTVFHWTYLSEIHAAPEIIKFGNYHKKGSVKVGTGEAVTRFGTLDLAGNVSEWVYNSKGKNKIIMGGNSQEPAYLYNEAYNVSPWRRSDLIGFRCMRYINDTLKQELSQQFDRTERDFSKAEPVSDEAFSIIKALYKYNKSELNARTIYTLDTLNWIQENIQVDVPYEDSPMQLSVFLPKNSEPPFQTVIYFPHDGPVYSNSLDDMPQYFEDLEFFVESGRAVVFPVYYNTFGRGDIELSNIFTWRQLLVYIVSDFQITCDYLQSRSDIDMEKMAYFGVSWGGFMAPYILAIEDRIKLGILVLFGAGSNDEYQDLDQLNYLPRVKIPMLMLGGRYDFAFTNSKQKAFYDFLGTPVKDKKWKIYETTHSIPRKDLVNESLDWLDNYFSEVNLK